MSNLEKHIKESHISHKSTFTILMTYIFFLRSLFFQSHVKYNYIDNYG